jgi:hypothetical protein
MSTRTRNRRKLAKQRQRRRKNQQKIKKNTINLNPLNKNINYIISKMECFKLVSTRLGEKVDTK